MNFKFGVLCARVIVSCRDISKHVDNSIIGFTGYSSHILAADSRLKHFKFSMKIVLVT